MSLSRFILKPGKEDSFRRFHPWVFSGAIQRVIGEPVEGDVVVVEDWQGNFVGVGHYQIGSIAVRILSFKPVEIDHTFYCERLGVAYEMRRSLGLENGDYNNAYRLVHGEGDNLPGLIIDIYRNTAVMQAHSPGMHYARHTLAKALKEVMGDKLDNIYYKSETTLPYKAALEQENEYLLGGVGEDTATENGLTFHVDWLRGQKTGFFVAVVNLVGRKEYQSGIMFCCGLGKVFHTDDIHQIAFFRMFLTITGIGNRSQMQYCIWSGPLHEIFHAILGSYIKFVMSGSNQLIVALHCLYYAASDKSAGSGNKDHISASLKILVEYSISYRGEK